MPSAERSFAVPPVDKMWYPRLTSSRANEATPVLSETLMSACLRIVLLPPIKTHSKNLARAVSCVAYFD